MNLQSPLLNGKRFVPILVRIMAILSLFLLVAPSPARADTSWCGPVSGTWTSAGNNHIVTCDIQVLSGTKLTIQPGVMVRFDPGTSLRVDGELVAMGATFTSNNPTPAKGNWGHIWFTSTSVDAVFDGNGNYLSGSTIQDSLVEWGGGGAGVKGQLEINGASPYISGNTFDDGFYRGIFAVGRSTTQKVIIEGNSVTENGGGINISTGVLVSNTISNNVLWGWESGDDGGGVYATNSTVERNLISNNTAPRYGGGVYASGSVLLQNTISGNTAENGGGGVYAVGGSVSNNTITGNTLKGYDAYGGGVYASGGSLQDNTISGNQVTNTASFGYGGGIYATLSTVTGNTISNNTVSVGIDAFGGGIYGSSTNISNNTISGNAANAGIAYHPNTGYGGGVYADGGNMTGNTVDNNHSSGSKDGLGGGVYSHIATIQQNTISNSGANRGGGIYAYKGTVTSNTVLTNTTALSGTLYIDQGTATLNILRANSAVAGGAIYGTGATLTGNTAENNAANYGAGIYAVNSTVNGNTLSGNDATSDGGGLYASGGDATHNSLLGNTVPSWGHGSGAYLSGVADFSYNDVLTNTATGGTSGGVSISGQPVFQYNNLYGNQPYDAELVSAQDADGKLNYWGLSACTAIPAQIYDGSDAPGRGKLAYAPSLYSPSPVAQLAAPSNLTLTSGQSSVTLSWSPIPAIPNIGCRVPGVSGPDWGYLVYYDKDSCPPFDGQGLPEGDSPILVSQNTSLSLGPLAAQGYVFAVTAYDYLGRESAYSNQVGIGSAEHVVYLPLMQR